MVARATTENIWGDGIPFGLPPIEDDARWAYRFALSMRDDELHEKEQAECALEDEAA